MSLNGFGRLFPNHVPDCDLFNESLIEFSALNILKIFWLHTLAGVEDK